MNWNYRIMKRKVSGSTFEYGIYEVFYAADGSIAGSTENSLLPTVDSPEGLKYELEMLMKAFEFEILDFTNETE